MGIRLGKRLRKLREKQGRGIKQVAPEIGLSYSYLSKLENGLLEPSENTIQRLATFYGEDPEVIGILAGKLPSDVLEILQNDPKAAVQILRERFGGGD